MCVVFVFFLTPLPRSDGGAGSCTEEARKLRGKTRRGGGQDGTEKAQKRRKHGDCPKNGVFGGIMKGETLAKFLLCIFFVFFGHVGAGGPQMDRTTFFSKILLVEAFWP